MNDPAGIKVSGVYHQPAVRTGFGASIAEGRVAGRWRMPLVIGWILVLSALIAPLPVSFPGPNLDTSWQAAMNDAYLHRLVWGTQIIWTYGPYGFLDSVHYYSASTWIWSFVAAVTVNVAFLTTLAIFLINLEAPWWMWLTLGVALLLPITRSLEVDAELLLISVFLLHLAVTSRWRFAVLFTVPAGFSLALLALLKGNYAAGGLGVIVCFFVLAALARRWRAVLGLAGATGISLVGLWALSEPLAGLPAYLRSMYEIVIGYSAAMSVWIEEVTISTFWAEVEVAIGAAILVAAGVTLIVMGVKRDLRAFSLALFAVPVTFITYKEVFVRYGPGRLPVLYGAVIVLALPIMFESIRSRLSWPARLAPGFSLALCVLLLLGLGATPLQTPISPDPLSNVQARLQGYEEAGRLIASPSLQREQDARTAAALRYYRFPPKFRSELHQGTFDAYPVDPDLGYAYGFHWDPRPVLQSYQGNTPYLDQADASHYAGAGGPHHVLFSVFGMDGRYGLFDEPATVRSLVYCYRVADSDGLFLLLQRRGATCVEPRLRRLNTVVAPLGTYVTVPHATGRVYADVHVRYSLFGQAADLAYRPSELHIQFHYGVDQTSPRFRYIPAVGVDGLLVSSYVANPADFQRVMANEPTTPIDALRVVAANPREYEATMTVTFYTDARSASS